MKKFSSFLFAAVLFISCSSLHVPVPGENTVKKENIYVEYMNIADAYSDQGKYDKAVTYYRYAMKNRKLYWTAYYKMGKACVFNKDWKEASKIYSRLLKRDTENLSIQMSLAYIYAMSGNLEAAENIYEYLWSRSDENSDVLVNYINVLFAEKKYDDVREKLGYLKEKFRENTNISGFEKKLEEETEDLQEKKADSSENGTSEE